MWHQSWHSISCPGIWSMMRQKNYNLQLYFLISLVICSGHTNYQKATAATETEEYVGDYNNCSWTFSMIPGVSFSAEIWRSTHIQSKIKKSLIVICFAWENRREELSHSIDLWHLELHLQCALLIIIKNIIKGCHTESLGLFKISMYLHCVDEDFETNIIYVFWWVSDVQCLLWYIKTKCHKQQNISIW